MKSSFLALGIVGILLLLAGIVFALQGSGMLAGSSMTGVSFWIYAGSGLAVLGVIMASLGFYMGSKSSTSKTTTADQETKKTAKVGMASSDSSTEDKDKPASAN